MPTGVALRDARSRLLAAGERVLLREGPTGLTSRTVTDEADVSKGVLHRHFASFDDFLVALVRQRIAVVEDVTAQLGRRAGDGTVPGNLCSALTRIFDPLGLAVVRLVLSHDGLGTRLRTGTSHGLPTLVEAVTGIAGYLTGEQQAGRIRLDATPDVLAQAVVGTGHLLFAGAPGGIPDPSAVEEAVEVVLAGAEG